MTFEDPELIKKYITEIKKYTDLEYYIDLKKKDRLQHEFALRDVFPTFAETHPFLFRKIVRGDDLTFLYKMLDSIDQINNGTLTQQQVEMTLGSELANVYVYPAMNAANANVNSNVNTTVNSNKFSVPLSTLTNPDILNS
uniref:Uncharacterized protein n=1 Tax=viral metagenome TaxID=1070528 RepID=A0A6C0GZM1_9ZZZZ